VSRRDDDRVADLLDAATEIGDIIKLGRNAWDKDRLRQLAVERLLCSRTITSESTQARCAARCPQPDRVVSNIRSSKLEPLAYSPMAAQ
jgi:hypothetical protein